MQTPPVIINETAFAVLETVVAAALVAGDEVIVRDVSTGRVYRTTIADLVTAAGGGGGGVTDHGALTGLGDDDHTQYVLANGTRPFTGTPTAPTAAAGTNTTQIATTEFVTAAVAAGGGGGGVTDHGALTGLGDDDHTQYVLANGTRPFTGTPTAPTAAAGTNTTQIATTAFVTAAVSPKAAIASPAFTGTPTAPTAAAGTNTTQIATTAFVTAAVASGGSDHGALTGLGDDDHTQYVLANGTRNFTGLPTAPTAAAGTNTGQLATTEFVTTAVSVKAPIVSPAFTGTPTAPTAAAGTSTTQLATTQFVTSAIAAAGATDHGALTGLGDDDHTQYVLANGTRPFTGTPTAPTAAAGTNTTQIATTAFVKTAVAASGGVLAATDGTTVTFDWSSGGVHTVTLGGNRTLAFSNPAVGQSVLLRLQQDATGSRTVTWPSGITWASGSPPVLRTAAAGVDVIEVTCVASGEYVAAHFGAASAAADNHVSVIVTTTSSYNATTLFTDVSGFSVTITPTSNSNKVHVSGHVNFNLSSSGVGGFRVVRVVGGVTTALAVGDAAGGRRQTTVQLNTSNQGGTSFDITDSPATTSAVTYKVQWVVTNGTIYSNRTAADTDGDFNFRDSGTMNATEIRA